MIYTIYDICMIWIGNIWRGDDKADVQRSFEGVLRLGIPSNERLQGQRHREGDRVASGGQHPGVSLDRRLPVPDPALAGEAERPFSGLSAERVPVLGQSQHQTHRKAVRPLPLHRRGDLRDRRQGAQRREGQDQGSRRKYHRRRAGLSLHQRLQLFAQQDQHTTSIFYYYQ